MMHYETIMGVVKCDDIEAKLLFEMWLQPRWQC